MSVGSRLATAGVVLVLGTTALTATGCDSEPAATVTQVNPNAEEGTSTLTPLERGALRREILDTVQTGIDAWIAGDTDGMRVVFNDDVMTAYERAWEDYEARGLTVSHVHEMQYYDVVDLNKSGTQALVKYRYADTSYLANASGERVEDLEVLDENEIQFTVEQQEDGSWMAVRIIGSLR